jgi:hypothetical protein
MAGKPTSLTHHQQLSQALSFINMKHELTDQYMLQMTQDLNSHQLLCMFLNGPSDFLASHCVCTTVHFRSLLLLCLWNETHLQSFNICHASIKCLYFTKKFTYFMFLLLQFHKFRIPNRCSALKMGSNVHGGFTLQN